MNEIIRLSWYNQIILQTGGSDMVHTFELSKMISKAMFEEIQQQLSWDYYKKGFFLTMKYAEYGFSAIRLYRFKDKKYKELQQIKNIQDEEYMYMNMVAITINIGLMFGKNGYHANDILSFTPDFVNAIYSKIYGFFPCLEQGEEYRTSNYRLWHDINAFKLRRIDFAFDLKTYADQYMTLINRGYSVRGKTYERTYFDNDTALLEEQADDEPNVADIEECVSDINGQYKSDVDYIYYKGKSLNINVYNKAEQLKREQQPVDNIDDYDYIRVEVQVKKNKLNAIVSKFGLKGRELQYLATPQVEEYVLNSYVKALTGAGLYVTQQQAFQIIDDSDYSNRKKQRLKATVKAITDKHGIAKVLEQIESGKITDLGKLPTVKTYLREIQNMGINPVTISARMNVPKTQATAVTGDSVVGKLTALPNLLDVLKSYQEQLAEEQQQGVTLTNEDFEQIDKL